MQVAAVRPIGRALLLASFVLGMVIALPQPARAQAGFEGECTTGGDGADGTCTIDEPEGNNPDTHGTVTFDRQTGLPGDDTITFTIDTEDPEGGDDPAVTQLQICIQPANEREDNPYTPTDANTCAGNQADRVYAEQDPPLEVEIDLHDALGDDFEHGEDIFFSLHINLDGRTTYVVGRSAQDTEDIDATHSLTVEKQVRNAPGSPTFDFTVDCGDYELSDLNNESEGVTYDDGDASFTLGDDESETFDEIPDETTCTVSEQVPAEGTWQTRVDGTVDEDRTVEVTLDDDETVVFTNRLVTASPETHALTVEKQVENAEDSPRFEFTVDCAEHDLSTQSNDGEGMTYEDGDASFTLGDDQTETFDGIPDGEECTISEEVPEDGTWSTAVDGTEDGDRTVVVTVGDDRTVVFTNTRQQQQFVITVTHALTVEKQVVGGTGETFTFTVDCGDYPLSPANNAGAGVTYENGDAIFPLGDDESQTFGALPEGTTCETSEDVPAGTWDTQVNGAPDQDRSAARTMSQDHRLVFTNAATVVGGEQQEPPPPPGDRGAAGAEGPPMDEEQPTRVLGAEVSQPPAELAFTGTVLAPLLNAAVALFSLGTVLLAATTNRRRRP